MANYLRSQLSGKRDHINIKQSAAMMCIHLNMYSNSLSGKSVSVPAENRFSSVQAALNQPTCAVLALYGSQVSVCGRSGKTVVGKGQGDC